MSDFFDEVARTLARPMPRRRALRLLGGAIAAAAVPGVSARPAQALGIIKCPPGTQVCTNGTSPVCMPTGGTCCIYPDLVVGCRPGYHCGDSRRFPCLCDGDDCGNRCCPKGKECGDGKCVSCTSERKCGNTCCGKGKFCASKKQSLCCHDGDNYCAVLPKAGSGGKAGKARCCSKGTTCCANDRRTDCCGPDQVCRSGECKCPPKTTPCGPDCCKKGETCSNGMCCPRGKVNCGGEGTCCNRVDCCVDVCCQGDTICANGTCCPPARGFGGGRNARCCPPGTVPTKAAITTACCPKSDPACCYDTDADIEVACAGGKTCVEGACVQL